MIIISFYPISDKRMIEITAELEGRRKLEAAATA
jgi:Na+/melibiose symporter-like transporter